MPRKVTKSLARRINPDRKYDNVKIAKLINKSMQNGKRQVAEKAVYSALEQAAKILKVEDPLAVFEQAFENISPDFEVKSRRVGGANYQIPFPVSGRRREHYAFIWLVGCARDKKGMPYDKRLALEIVDAYHKTGVAFKKKEDTHKMAEANRAFAHFAR